MHWLVQQRRILRDHTDMRAQAVLRNFAHRLTVNQNAPSFDIVKPEEEIDH